MQKPNRRQSILLIILLWGLLFSACGRKQFNDGGETNTSNSKATRKAENKAQVNVDIRLHRASGDGDTEAVLQLLGMGIDVNAVDEAGQTPLHKAASRGQAGVAQILLDHGAKIDAEDKWSGKTPLHLAWGEKNKEVAYVLITYGADVNARDKNGTTPLHSALYPVAEVLIANGADVNVRDAKGETPLHWAAFGGYWQVAELLIKKGADVNARSNNGGTPLHSAGTAIITKGPQDGRRTALLLITNGADVNAKDLHEDTPLHKAVEMNNVAVTETIIAKGCDVNAKDRNGSTPLFFAASPNIIQLLELHGGKNEGSLRLVPVNPDKD
jgi:ankyrin repeat protein